MAEDKIESFGNWAGGLFTKHFRYLHFRYLKCLVIYGFTYFFEFSPRKFGEDEPILTNIFSKGMVQPPTRKGLAEILRHGAWGLQEGCCCRDSWLRLPGEKSWAGVDLKVVDVTDVWLNWIFGAGLIWEGSLYISWLGVSLYITFTTMPVNWRTNKFVVHSFVGGPSSIFAIFAASRKGIHPMYCKRTQIDMCIVHPFKTSVVSWYDWMPPSFWLFGLIQMVFLGSWRLNNYLNC